MFIKESFYTRVPNAPLLPGLSFRHFRGEQDYSLMAELVNVANEADGVPEASTAEEMAHYANPKNIDPYRDVLIAEVNGEAVCYSRVYWLDEADGTRIYRSTGFLHPDWRRKGIGTAMLAFNERRIRKIAVKHPAGLAKLFEVTVPDVQAGARVLLQQFGYSTQRHFFIMSRPLDSAIPQHPLPEGLELRPVQSEHMRAIWDATEEAFQDHWGFMPRNEEDYQRWLHRPSTDTSLWKVAWDGDQVAGLSLNYIFEGESERLGVRQAWTEPIAVRRPWRKRGLARALLLASQREMKARGMQQAVLEVDTQNPNQALHLYDSCGYETERRWDLYRKELN